MSGIVAIFIICGLAIAAVPIFPIYFWFRDRRRSRAQREYPATTAQNVGIMALAFVCGLLLVAAILLFGFAETWIRDN